MHQLSKQQWKTILLSSLGGGLEYYDFVIFIIFAQYIGQTFSFSQQESQFAQLFFALALFAVGYLARPIGGILFSHLGDKIGRKKAFSLSIFTMAFSTLGMGLLPSYETWGIIATILFTLLRIIQGLSLGGELPGAITFLKEHCPKHPGFACGILYFCVNTGIVLADGIHTLLASIFTPAELLIWGWRIAFFIGSSLGILAYFLRKRLEETPEFLKVKQNIQKIPLLSLLKNYPGSVILGFFAFSLAPLGITLLLLYINSYLSFLSLDQVTITHIALSNALIVSVVIPFFGKLADRWGYQKLLILSSLIFLLSPFIFYIVLIQPIYTGLCLGFLSIFVGSAMISSVLLIAHTFPTEVRYSGIAMCYNLSFAIFGGISPLVASFLIKEGIIIAPALLLQFAAIITLLGALGLMFCRKKILSTGK